jgi:histidyl-tRNA synthetase
MLPIRSAHTCYKTETERSFPETLEFLRADEILSKNEQVQKGVKEMDLLHRYLTASDIADSIKLDLSLARGLDYYTGLIYEVVPNDPVLNVGSIAAGGRYDNLVGTFSRRDIPCVGISFGVDRILTILNAQSNTPRPVSRIDAWIVAYGSSLLVEEKMSIARQLRRTGISVDFDSKADRKPRKQLELAESNGAVVAILLEDDASSPGGVRVKMVGLPAKNAEKQADVIDRACLLEQFQKRLTMS